MATSFNFRRRARAKGFTLSGSLLVGLAIATAACTPPAPPESTSRTEPAEHTSPETALVANEVTPARIDAPAPDFTVVDSNGISHTLSQYKGKIVVLEWTNHQCPFVGKHYGSGNMQALQAEATAEGVVWLSIISSAPGQQGHVDGAGANEQTVSRGASPTAVLLDSEGDVGRLYGARTTPHMYVIDPEGLLRYMGGIDNIPSADPGDIDSAQNYVRPAIASVQAGEAVETATAPPYGCSVKYAS